MNTMKRVYIDAQKGCGIKVGDLVRITGQPFDNESGWGERTSDDFHEHIGNTYPVREIEPDNIVLDATEGQTGSFVINAPYFVLEKVEAAKARQEFYTAQPVLVRDTENQLWSFSLYSHRSAGDHKHMCINGIHWRECIPYAGNERLLGTMNDPVEK